MFVVLEIQTTESTMSATPWKFDSLAEAKQKYHSVLAFAAVSSVPIHTAMIVSSYGQVVSAEYFEHIEQEE